MEHQQIVRTDPRLILVLVSRGARMLDVAAVIDAFSEASHAGTGKSRYSIRLISAEADYDPGSDFGLFDESAISYRDFSEAADTLIIIGPNVEGRPRLNSELLSWLRRQAAQTRRVASVSSGVFVLADAGLLDGRRATTHWKLQDHISTSYPLITFVEDVIYVRDGKYYTGAGATGAIDLALAFVEEDFGAHIATEVARSMLLYLRRPGATRQISFTLDAQDRTTDQIADLLAWLPDNLQQDLSVKSLAKRAAMSPRNFARIFKKQLEITPAQHIQNLRLEAAQRQLAAGDVSLKVVAQISGLANRDTLRRLFVRRLNTAPEDYRSLSTVRSEGCTLSSAKVCSFKPE